MEESQPLRNQVDCQPILGGEFKRAKILILRHKTIKSLLMLPGTAYKINNLILMGQTLRTKHLIC